MLALRLMPYRYQATPAAAAGSEMRTKGASIGFECPFLSLHNRCRPSGQKITGAAGEGGLAVEI